MNNKKPPDYFSKKGIFKNLLRNPNDLDVFKEAVIRTNKIIIPVLQFIEAYYLWCYDNNQVLPEFDEKGNFISLVFSVILRTDIKSLKESNKVIYRPMNEFYNNHFSTILCESPVPSTHINQVLNYAKISIMTAIRNNIKVHFVKRLFGYINAVWDHANADKYEQRKTRKEKLAFRKSLRSKLKAVKNDILNGTQTCDSNYRQWVSGTRELLVPLVYEKSIPYDLEVNPFKYLRYMIFMNKHLESMNMKQFHCFPLRSDLIPKSITIDTIGLMDLFYPCAGYDSFGSDLKALIECQNQVETLQQLIIRYPGRIDWIQSIYETLVQLSSTMNPEQYRTLSFKKIKKLIAWNLFFNMKNRMFKGKNNGFFNPDWIRTHNYEKDYEFDFSIHTDGISVSTRFVRIRGPNCLKTNESKGTRKQSGKARKKVKDTTKDEFTYLDDLDENQIADLQNRHLVYVDPNKGNLIYCVDGNIDSSDQGGTFFRYTRKQRLAETRRIKQVKAVLNYRKETIISYNEQNPDGNLILREKSLVELETILSKYSSKTSNFQTFMEYLSIKNRINLLTAPAYGEEFLRKMKLRAYINKQRSESKLIRNIKWTYGANDARPITLIYGDWSVPKQMKHIISTPMIGLKRRLHKAFDIINIDEFRTSCLDWRTEARNEKVKVVTKSKKTKSLNAVLVSTLPSHPSGAHTGLKRSFQNRDRNSVLNIRKVARHFFAHRNDTLGQRPYNYRRSTKDIIPLNSVHVGAGQTVTLQRLNTVRLLIGNDKVS
jgi:hypothetical protein